MDGNQSINLTQYMTSGQQSKNTLACCGSPSHRAPPPEQPISVTLRGGIRAAGRCSIIIPQIMSKSTRVELGEYIFDQERLVCAIAWVGDRI